MAVRLQRASTLKVGLLTVVSLSLLIFTLIWLRGRGIGGGEQYRVDFPDVDGMREGSAVQMMGIRVGFVDAIQPVLRQGHYFVQVDFSVNNPEVEIPTGSRLSIEQSGVIGEKFLEITPPTLQKVLVQSTGDGLVAPFPVRFPFLEGTLDVGTVERVEKKAPSESWIYYRITKPGFDLPDEVRYGVSAKAGKAFLDITPLDRLARHVPDPALRFTVEKPLRLKRFLELQLQSAEALEITNEKINRLLSDDTIATLQTTVKNTEVLTARATQVLDTASTLFKTTNEDLEQLVVASHELMTNVNQMSRNVNGLIGDPQIQADLKTTVTSLRESTETLNRLAHAPELQETLDLTRDTSRNVADVASALKKTVEDKELQARLDQSLTLLNGSLSKLSAVLENVDTLTDDKDQTLQTILKDTRESTENLKAFSKRLTGRFVLLRLLF